jgi:hypothetical protein
MHATRGTENRNISGTRLGGRVVSGIGRSGARQMMHTKRLEKKDVAQRRGLETGGAGQTKGRGKGSVSAHIKNGMIGLGGGVAKEVVVVLAAQAGGILGVGRAAPTMPQNPLGSGT